ncbi:hypothetical protein BKK79_06760 [Cupriavidus sp. USMAA2-4]|uniref:DNA-binding response regulator n=1 Tax=Cupriavidus malaysiensis TaxID=367825 RepID=A0ABM6F2I5_9BURK|nr:MULTISPECIES: response regulator transcription factor [Cupriavidus]AOY91549.1 hypothetical protein BKK79_06760 [Cupriavidus sp. USMAA2-4]AOY98902.1 hypothetical protein BKK81_06220 [Cupriavidus sp. USMAHM13]AOZ05328.1 hypothetical protein BKK80_05525 [Cupriavidus malaysiensis]
MVSVILLEDEPVLRSELAGYLTECGHRTDAVGTLAEFRQVFSPCDHAIAVIDLGLPDGDGIDLIDWLRAHGRRLGIIVVSARSSTAERVRGLMIGADHYLGKPFDLEELAATVAALGRRLAAGGVSTRWILDVGRRQILPPGEAPICLTAQAFIILRAIAAGRGAPVNRREIVNALSEDYDQYDQRRLDTHVYQLRKAVQAASGMELPIRSARGRGYQFLGEVDIQQP